MQRAVSYAAGPAGPAGLAGQRAAVPWPPLPSSLAWAVVGFSVRLAALVDISRLYGFEVRVLHPS